MAILTPDMKRIIAEQKLGFVATVNADGTPNLSPKATMQVLDDEHIFFADIRSPGTMANLARNPAALLPERYRAFVVLQVTRAAPLISPAYDAGATEPGLRQQYWAYFESLQPKE